MADACIAAQNAVTAAESLGIGSCYIGDILEQCRFHRQLLHLPEYVVPCAMLVLGYPTRQQKERPKPARCALEHIVHTNAYDAWMEAFCKRKYESDFSREMTRSVEEYLKAFDSGPSGVHN